MLERLLQFIINLFFWLIGLIGTIIIYPVQVLIVTIFPTLGQYITITLNFFTQQVFPIISFIKGVIINIACIPNELWLIYMGVIITAWGIIPAIHTIRLIINIWKLKSGGSTK